MQTNVLRTGIFNRYKKGKGRIFNTRTGQLYLLVIAIILFSIHYFVFWDYINDDAGITFGSAKTLLDYGRFSIDQFAERVEAYSNPLWTTLLAGIYSVGVPIPIAAKIMNWLLGIITLLAVYLIHNRYGKRLPESKRWMNTMSPLMLALMTGFVLWGAAGLENGLYAFLTAGLIYGALRFEESSKIILVTLFSFLISITRPEGLLLAIFVYSALLIRFFIRNGGYRKLFLSACVVLLLYGLFLVGRYHIYGWIFPNTYYAKIGDPYLSNFYNIASYTLGFIVQYWPLFLFGIFLSSVIAISNYKHGFLSKGCIRSTKLILSILLPLLIVLTGILDFYIIFKVVPNYPPIPPRTYVKLIVANLVVIGPCAALMFGLVKSREPANYLNKLLGYGKTFIGSVTKNKIIWYSTFIVLANIVYVFYAGATWGTTRFWSPTLVSLALILTELFKDAFAWSWKYVKVAKTTIDSKKIIATLMIGFVLQMACNTTAVYNNPIVSFWDIKRHHADLGNEIGGYLISNQYLPNAKHVPYMVPDLGATSYFAENYTIIDTIGLGNVPIAHNRYETSFFKDYIFNITKPIIIGTRQDWSLITNIGSYEEFSNHYELVRGAGIVKYKGADVPVGYYILTDIFVSNAGVPVNISKEYLPLKNYDINGCLFSRDGEMQLSTYWQKSSSRIQPQTIDNHIVAIFLRNLDNEYLIDEHQIAGGYYLPSKWNVSSVILDKRTISIENVPEGDYALTIQVSYPDGKKEVHKVANITITSNYQKNINLFIGEFNDSINKVHDNVSFADITLKKIKAISMSDYETYREVYIKIKLNYIGSLIENEEYSEAYGLLYPLVGSQIYCEKLNTYLRQTEIDLSNLIERKAKILEEKGETGQAIVLYEKSIWLNPDKSHLRRHVEIIR